MAHQNMVDDHEMALCEKLFPEDRSLSNNTAKLFEGDNFDYDLNKN